MLKGFNMKTLIFIGIVIGVLYFAKDGINKGASVSTQSYDHEQAIKKEVDQ